MSDETKVERKELSEQKEISNVEKPRAEGPKAEESKTFTTLVAYENVFPIVVRTIKLIESLDQFKIRHEVLLEQLYESSTGIILNLADGYNRYHREDKAELYNKARSCLSRTQSILFLLHALGIFNKKVVFGLCNEYEDCLRFLNGLIRTIETTARGTAKKPTTKVGGGQIDVERFKSIPEDLRYVLISPPSSQKISQI